MSMTCYLGFSPDDGTPTDPAMMNLQGTNQWSASYTIPAFRSAQSTLNGGTPTKYSSNQIEVKHFHTIYCQHIISQTVFDMEPRKYKNNFFYIVTAYRNRTPI